MGHITKAQIDGVVRATLKQLRAGRKDGGRAQVYVRLADPVVEAFLRWHIGERNRGSQTDDVLDAIAEIVGWMIAQVAIAVPPENHVRVAEGLAEDAVRQAIAFLRAPIVAQAQIEEGGNA